MGTLRCTSRSIVLKNALRSLSRCTLAAGQKQKPQKVESTPPIHDQKGGGGISSLVYGRFVRLTPKTEQNKSPNKCGYKAQSASGLTSNTQSAVDPIQNARRRSSFIFAVFNRQKPYILKRSLTQNIV